MLIPYSTDAPLYHPPVVTIVIIVLSLLGTMWLFVAPDIAAEYILVYGDGLHPTQWLLSNFLHADLIHLLGNAMALWVFGMIVEGKIGWWRTLLVMLGIGVGQCAVEQVVMLGVHEGGSLGSSSIAFGLMAMTLVWAPKNDVNSLFFVGFRPFAFTAPISGWVGGMLLLEILIVALTGLTWGSQILHLMGATLGGGLAVWMLKTNRVDCEDWDIFSVWAGRHTLTREDRAVLDANDPRKQAALEQRQRQEQEQALAEIRQRIEGGHAKGALHLYERLGWKWPDWKLPEPDLMKLIIALHKQQLWTESIPAMVNYLRQYTKRAIPIRLVLAQILVQNKRPAQALKVLDKVPPDELLPDQRRTYEKLAAKAHHLRAEDPYELAEDDW